MKVLTLIDTAQTNNSNNTNNNTQQTGLKRQGCLLVSESLVPGAKVGCSARNGRNGSRNHPAGAGVQLALLHSLTQASCSFVDNILPG
jgi:hypothetical protein